MNMRETILSILREHKIMKIVEVALQVWARQNQKKIPNGVWQPTPEGRAEIQKTERLVTLFLPRMMKDGVVDTTLDWKWIRLKEVK